RKCGSNQPLASASSNRCSEPPPRRTSPAKRAILSAASAKRPSKPSPARAPAPSFWRSATASSRFAATAAAPQRDSSRSTASATIEWLAAQGSILLESRQLQQELDRRSRDAQEASHRKTQFLAAVSHDVRTPANAVNLAAEVIERSCGQPGFVQNLPELIAM